MSTTDSRNTQSNALQSVRDTQSTICEMEHSTIMTVPNNLTGLGRNLGLEPTHKRRRTHQPRKDWSNATLDPQRLPGYIFALDSKRGISSWIFQWGPRVQDIKRGHIRWLCWSCYEAGKITLISVESSTSSAAYYMEHEHNVGKEGEIKAKRGKGASVINMLQTPAAGNLLVPFKAADWRKAYMRWVLLDGISFRGAILSNFRAMWQTAAPIVSRFVLQSHTTISKWTHLEYCHAFDAMVASLHSA